MVATMIKRQQFQLQDAARELRELLAELQRRQPHRESLEETVAWMR
jgi:hypothetical protein